MTVIDAASVAQALVAGLVGRRCSVVDASYANQLVVGFGQPSPAPSPLDGLTTTPWMLYTSFGAWEVRHAAEPVASDRDELVDGILAELRRVLVGHAVTAASLGSEADLRLVFGHDSVLTVRRGDDLRADEPGWELTFPGGLVVEAVAEGAIARLDDR